MDMNVSLNASLTAQAAPGSVPSTAATPVKNHGAAEPETYPKRAELEQAVKDIQAFVASSQRNLDFSIDDTTHQVVVKVIATETGEVIRQIPSEAALKLAQSLSDVHSLLFSAKA
jgi:flagellar protein FlaG